MIAKHIPMKSARRSDFAGLVKYITDDQGLDHRLGQICITNCDSIHLSAATAEVLATQLGNTRATGDKTYHLVLSFRSGERPSNEDLKSIEKKVCQGLGFGEHQRISAVHEDTDNLHIHVAINKIHPTKNTMFEPYLAYKKLAKICSEVEDDFGLESDNHTVKRTRSEGLASDMERHSGIQSLVSWIRSGCLDDLRKAESWKDVHKILDGNALRLRPQGAGLVFQSGETVVKASTVARDLSKAQLEKRLGKFKMPVFRYEGEAKARKYEARPVERLNRSSGLFERYKAEQDKNEIRRNTALRKARAKRDRAISAAKRANKLKRSAIKVSDAKNIGKRVLYSQTRKALLAKTKDVQAEYKRELEKIYGEMGRKTWADWLKQEAKSGNAEAVEAMRRRRKGRPTSPSSMNSISGEVSSVDHSSNGHSFTKTGSIVYPDLKGAVRFDGEKLLVKGLGVKKIGFALDAALTRFDGVLSVKGSPEFKAQLIVAAAKKKVAVVFADASLEALRQEMKEKLKGESGNERRRSNSAGIGSAGWGAARHGGYRGVDGEQRGSGRELDGARKPNIGRVGRKPPPESQNRLRSLSELGLVQLSGRGEMLLQGNVSSNVEQQGAKSVDRVRRDFSGAGIGDNRSGIQAAEKYIAEREEKRNKGFDISVHYLYNEGSQKESRFAGLRNVDGENLALMEGADGKIGVLPVSSKNASRLKNIRKGEMVSLNGKGEVIRKKGRTI